MSNEYIPENIEPTEETSKELIDFYMQNLDMLPPESDLIPNEQE